MSVTGEGDALFVYGAFATSSFFDVFGRAPMLGRTFGTEDEVAGGEPVVVLSYGLWVRRFGSDASMLGKQIVVDGVSRRVVGVMPRGFGAPAEWIDPTVRLDLWIPFIVDVTQQTRGNRSYNPVARLRAGVSLEAATTELQGIASRLRAVYPESNEDWELRVKTWKDVVVGSSSRVLIPMWCAMGLLLLVACANVGNVVLNRALARRGELLVQAALGADTARLVRGALLEAALLSCAALIVGISVAYIFIAAVHTLDPGSLPRLSETALDVRVFAATAALGVIAALLVAAVPAFHAAHTNAADSLRGRTQSGSAGLRQSLFRSTLAVLQLSMALALLIGSGLALLGFTKLRNVSPGFDQEGLLTATVVLSRERVPEMERRAAFVTQVLERLRATPGVSSAAMINSLPFSGSHAQQTFAIAGVPVDPDAEPFAGLRSVSPDYARTMGIPLRGRDLSQSDIVTTPAAILVNDALASRYFADRDALGERLLLQDGELQVTIVGVMGDVRHFGLTEPARPEIFLPYSSDYLSSKTFVVRTEGDPYAVQDGLRRAILDTDSNQPLRASGLRRTEVIAMRDLIDDSVAGPRFYSLVLALLAALAGVLSALGLFAVISHTVTERRHEIGVRMAVGAARKNVLLWILGRTARITIPAGAGGVIIVLIAGKALESLLFGVSAREPMIFAAAIGIFVAVAVMATVGPARRGGRSEPAQILRGE
jgi:predicted permease